VVNNGIEVLKTQDSLQLKISGRWQTSDFEEMQERIQEALQDAKDVSVSIDISGLSLFDSSAALFLLKLKRENPNTKLYGFTPALKSLFRLAIVHTRNKQENFTPIKKSFLERVGRLMYDKSSDFIAYAEFFGALIYSLGGLFQKHNFRIPSLIRQVELSSVNALPIVAVSAFLIGVVVTYQGALQLEKFGAAIFTVDLVGISITRELAPLLTAVVIAGRSGASYTSELGVMKITEEIDAMKTMGLNPYYFLVWPRILALTLTLWLVIFFADAVAVVGGMIIAKVQLGISYTEFLQRLQSSLALKHILVGLAKAPFFAFLIASIGVFRGLQVQGSSESIGVMTTHSVVNSIFAVIACDALFAVIFTRFGI
jgi:phospholipid/cholesterol/gamma-HCH transport system permease protein